MSIVDVNTERREVTVKDKPLHNATTKNYTFDKVFLNKNLLPTHIFSLAIKQLHRYTCTHSPRHYSHLLKTHTYHDKHTRASYTPSTYLKWFCGVVVITSALHAKGNELELY